RSGRVRRDRRRAGAAGTGPRGRGRGAAGKNRGSVHACGLNAGFSPHLASGQPWPGLCCDTHRRRGGTRNPTGRDMRKHLLGLMILAGLAGCSSDNGSDSAVSAAEALSAESFANGIPTDESLAAMRGSANSFASLPDRGGLLAYRSEETRLNSSHVKIWYAV